MMQARWMAVTLAAAGLAGCGGLPRLTPAKPATVAGDPLTTCPKTDPCSKIANRRQYYDQRVVRYYYFDTNTGRYYWENGQPRFPETVKPPVN